MPRVREFEAAEDREANRFRDWVRGECRRKHITQARLSDELLISEVAMSRKMSGETNMRLSDVITICSILGPYTFGGAE